MARSFITAPRADRRNRRLGPAGDWRRRQGAWQVGPDGVEELTPEAPTGTLYAVYVNVNPRRCRGRRGHPGTTRDRRGPSGAAGNRPGIAILGPRVFRFEGTTMSSLVRPLVRGLFGAALLLFAAAASAALPAGITAGASVEGISEYDLANGLKVLLFPDASQPKVTVNITYLV